jgi:hypothetical protein
MNSFKLKTVMETVYNKKQEGEFALVIAHWADKGYICPISPIGDAVFALCQGQIILFSVGTDLYQANPYTSLVAKVGVISDQGPEIKYYMMGNSDYQLSPKKFLTQVIGLDQEEE